GDAFSDNVVPEDESHCMCCNGSRERAHGTLAGDREPGRLAVSRFTHDVGEPARHVAHGTREAGELALLARDRLGAGVPVRRPGALPVRASVHRVSGGFRGRLCGMAEDLSTSPAGQLALAHVPGFAAWKVDVTPLPGGGFNRSYAVRTPAGRFVLRWSPAPDAWLAADRSAERPLQTLAAS